MYLEIVRDVLTGIIIIAFIVVQGMNYKKKAGSEMLSYFAAGFSFYVIVMAVISHDTSSNLTPALWIVGYFIIIIPLAIQYSRLVAKETKERINQRLK